jgi:hypothetical protein
MPQMVKHRPQRRPAALEPDSHARLAHLTSASMKVSLNLDERERP